MLIYQATTNFELPIKKDPLACVGIQPPDGIGSSIDNTHFILKKPSKHNDTNIVGCLVLDQIVDEEWRITFWLDGVESDDILLSCQAKYPSDRLFELHDAFYDLCEAWINTSAASVDGKIRTYSQLKKALLKPLKNYDTFAILIDNGED